MIQLLESTLIRSPPARWSSPSLVLACGIAIAWHRGPSADILWFLDVAKRVATVRRLHDILEVNPPLIVWMLLPFARLTHPLPAFLGIVVLIMAASSVATTRALGGSWTLPALLTVGLIVPIGWFGQREHLAIALILPWLVSTLNVEGARWPLGILAGLGFALKPHLLLAFLLIVLFRRRVDPGTRAAAVVTLVIYVMAVAVLAPGYGVGPVAGGDYWAYQRVGLPELLWKNPCAWLAAVGPAAWLLVRPGTTDRTHGDGLTLATLGFLAGAVVQSKGWNYHYAPAISTSLLLLYLSAAQPMKPVVLLMRFASAAIVFGFAQQAWRDIIAGRVKIRMRSMAGPINDSSGSWVTPGTRSRCWRSTGTQVRPSRSRRLAESLRVSLPNDLGARVAGLGDQAAMVDRPDRPRCHSRPARPDPLLARYDGRGSELRGAAA